MLEKTKLKLPNAVKTGTTIAGIVFKVSRNSCCFAGRLHFLTWTFAESKLRFKYVLKSKSEVILLSQNPLRLLTLAE